MVGNIQRLVIISWQRQLRSEGSRIYLGHIHRDPSIHSILSHSSFATPNDTYNLDYLISSQSSQKRDYSRDRDTLSKQFNLATERARQRLQLCTPIDHIVTRISQGTNLAVSGCDDLRSLVIDHHILPQCRIPYSTAIPESSSTDESSPSAFTTTLFDTYKKQSWQHHRPASAERTTSFAKRAY